MVVIVRSVVPYVAPTKSSAAVAAAATSAASSSPAPPVPSAARLSISAGGRGSVSAYNNNQNTNNNNANSSSAATNPEKDSLLSNIKVDPDHYSVSQKGGDEKGGGAPKKSFDASALASAGGATPFVTPKIVFTRQHAELTDLEKLSQKAHAAVNSNTTVSSPSPLNGGGKRRPTVEIVGVGGDSPRGASGPKKKTAENGDGPTVFNGSPSFLDGPQETYEIEGILIRDIAPPPVSATTKTPTATTDSPTADSILASKRAGGGGAKPRGGGLLSMLAQQSASSPLAAASSMSGMMGGVLTSHFVPAPTHVEESLLPLTAHVRRAAVSRNSTVVVHRSTPATNEGGIVAHHANANAAGGGGGRKALAGHAAFTDGGHSTAGGAHNAGEKKSVAGPSPPSAPAVATTPSPSEHYFPQMVDAIIHGITPATERALQIVADDAAKEKQMIRLRQAGGDDGGGGVGGGGATTPSALSPRLLMGRPSTAQNTVAGLVAGADGLVGDGAGASEAAGGRSGGTTPQANKRPSIDMTPKGLSPALTLALKAAHQKRDVPSAPNSARLHYNTSSGRANSYSGGSAVKMPLSARPPTSGSVAGGSGRVAGASSRFQIYASTVNFALPVIEHGRTLAAEGLQVKPPRKVRKSDVGFDAPAGAFGDDGSSNDDDDDEAKKKMGELKRSASLRRKSSTRALQEFEANRPVRPADVADEEAVVVPPLPNNGWSPEMTVYEFDGYRSYLQLPTVPDLENLIKCFTVDFWLLSDCQLSEGRRTVLYIGDQSSGRPEVGMQLHIGLNWYSDLDEGLRLFIRDASNRVLEVYIPFAGVSTGANILNGNEPHHFKISVLSLEEAYIHAFVDGEPIENSHLKFLQSERASTFSTWTGPLYIGGVPNGDSGLALQQQEVLHPLRGSVFELRFWRGDGNYSSILNNRTHTNNSASPSKPLTAADVALQERIQTSEPWVRWPLINPPPIGAVAGDANAAVPTGADGNGNANKIIGISTGHLRIGGVGSRMTDKQLLFTEATRRVDPDHQEIRNDLRPTRRFNPRVCPVFDGASTVINMGTMNCFGDFLNHFEVEFVFKTTETKKCMSLLGFTDSQHKMCEVGVVLNAEPIMGNAASSSSSPPSSPSAGGGGAGVDKDGAALPAAATSSPTHFGHKERYRHHEYTVTFYIVDCSGRCLSAFIRGTERNSVMDGRWHTLRIRVVDAEQGVVDARIDGLTRETIKVVKESPRTFLALKDWVCVGGHNDRGQKVANIFVGQISQVSFIIRGEDFAKLTFSEGPGSGISLDQSGRRNHGLFMNPITKRNKKHAMEWGLVFDSNQQQYHSSIAAGGPAGLTSGSGTGALLGSGGAFDSLLATQMALYGNAAADPSFAVMHEHNAVRVAVVQFGAHIPADGKGGATEIMYDLIKNERIEELSQVYESLSAQDKGFGAWLTIPDEHFAEVTNSQRLREIVSYALRHSTVRGKMRHTLVTVRIGDAHISFLDISGPHYNAHTSITYDHHLLKWVPHAVATNGDANKAMIVVNDQTNGLWKTLHELSEVPNVVLKLGPHNQRDHRVTSAHLLHSLQDAGTRWRLALTIQHMLMNAYLRTGLHFVCSVSSNPTASDVESIVCPQKALRESARDRAAVFIQRIWRRKLAMMLVKRLMDRRRLRKQRVEEIINLRKTNPLVLPKKILRALVITLHAFPNCPRLEPIDPTISNEVVDALGKQGYTVEHLRNPTRSQLVRAFNALEADSSHFVYIHGYGGFVRQRMAPPLNLDRLLLCLEEEKEREEVMLQATVAMGHLTKARWEDLAHVKAVLAAMPVKKGRKKGMGGSPQRATSPASMNATLASAAATTAALLNATATTAASSRPPTSGGNATPSGLNTTPRRQPSAVVTSPRARNQQSKAQLAAALAAQLAAVNEEFRVLREELEATEAQRRMSDVWQREEHSRVLLLQEFSKALRMWHSHTRAVEEDEARQARVAKVTMTTVKKDRDSCGINTAGLSNAATNRKSSPSSPDNGDEDSAAAAAGLYQQPKATRWFIYPSEAKRVEPVAADLIPIDDLVAKALQKPNPPLGYQCVVAVDLQAPTPSCHGGALLFSSTGHHYTFAYDGYACLAAFGDAAASGANGKQSSPSAAAVPVPSPARNRSSVSRKSFTSGGITGGPAVAAAAATAAAAAHKTAGGGATASAATASFGNTAQQQSNILSWVLAKALSGHVPRIVVKNKEWYLQGSCDTPASSGQRDWKSFSYYVASKVDMYVRNDTSQKERKEEELLKKRQREREEAAMLAMASSGTIAQSNGGSAALLSSSGSGGVPTSPDNKANKGSRGPSSSFVFGSNSTNSHAAVTSSSPLSPPASPGRKRLSVVLANAPSMTPAVELMLEKDQPYTSDLVPIRNTVLDAEERANRRKDREMRRVTSYAKIGVECSRVLGDMQYEFRPLLVHLNVTDINMAPTVRLLLQDGMKDVDGVDTEWIAAEAKRVFATISADLDVEKITVLGSGIFIDVMHHKGERTRVLQGVQLLAAKAQHWAIPLLPSTSIASEAYVDYSQVVFLVKCMSPLRKMRMTMKDLMMGFMKVPSHLTILKYGLDVQ